MHRLELINIRRRVPVFARVVNRVGNAVSDVVPRKGSVIHDEVFFVSPDGQGYPKPKIESHHDQIGTTGHWRVTAGMGKSSRELDARVRKMCVSRVHAGTYLR